MTANGEKRFGPVWTERVMSADEIDLCSTLNDENLYPKLDPPETTSPNKADWSYRGRFMAGKEKEYEATLEAYRAIYKGESNNHTQALTGCRTYASMQRDAVTGEVKVFGDSCRDRWCPMCAGQKRTYAKQQAVMYMQSLKKPRFLGLTLRNDESDLKSQLTFLQDSFARIRQRAYWKKNVTGGIWFIHIKRGKNSGCWHPHFHILLDGNYLDQTELSRLWELVTYGSPIIKIEEISDIEFAAKYVARYSARPAMLSEMPNSDRIEVIEALFRKRLSGTFGTGKSVTLTPPKVEATGDWQYVGHYDDIVERAEYCPAARAIMVAYNTYEPLSEQAFEDFTGHAPGDLSVFDPPPPKEKQLLLDFYNR